MRCALAVLLLAGLVPAVPQDAPVTGPVLGYAWDAASLRLRPILGLPGSSILGAPLDIGAAVSDAEVSPNQEYALAVEADSRGVLLVAWTGGRASVRPLPGGLQPADRIAISPGGGAAAVYSASGPALYGITGLPASPSVATWDLPGPLTALAVSDAGDRVLAVSGGLLYLLARGAEPRPAGPVGADAALAFLQDSPDALVADPARQEVFLLRGESERLILAGARDGIADPAAIAAVGRQAWVANRGSNTIVVLDLDGGAPAQIACPCEVAGLQRLRGHAVFRLTGSLRATSYLLEGGPAGSRLWFIPPDAASVRPARERSR